MAARNNPPAPPTERELTITRVFAAPRSLVFKAWTEPERIKQWWGPRGFVTLSCEMDFRPGGLWCTRSKAPDGQEYVARSVFREIVEPVLARSVVLSVARHRPHTLATREIQALVLSMAPGILTEADAA